MSEIHINDKLEGVLDLLQGKSIYVVIDKNLAWLDGVLRKNGATVIYIETSEQQKTLESVASIAQLLLEKGANRDAFIVGVGGGLTTDIAGFVASIYKRGVKFAFVPTTLLAQTDASIGGKNGVNFHSFKNILGTINQPEWIYICTEVLQTLPPKEFRAGIAEVLKTFILFDNEYYTKAVEYFTELEEHLHSNGTYLHKDNFLQSYDNSQDVFISGGRFYKEDVLLDIIAKCAEYKSGVVERDEFERGERRLLNLGHTFAHSIEKICGENPADYEPIMHGEAVAIGMVLAAKVGKAYYTGSRQLEEGNAVVSDDLADSKPDGFVEALVEDLKDVGLPVGIPKSKNGEKIPMNELVEALRKDKKATGGSIHFIMPKGVGHVEDVLISFEKLEEIANGLC